MKRFNRSRNYLKQRRVLIKKRLDTLIYNEESIRRIK